MPVDEMPEIKSNYFSVTIPVPTDLDEAAKTKHIVEMRMNLRNWVKIRTFKCKGFYEDDKPLIISNPKTTYLEFYEPKFKSNLRTLLPDYFFTRLTEEEFKNRTKDLTNHLIRPNPIASEHAVRFSNIRIRDMKPITKNDGLLFEETLWTFTIDTQKRFLKDIHGMVGKISFENPDGNEIQVYVHHKMLHTVTHNNYVEFTIPKHPTRLTPGQLVQTVASGFSDIATLQRFPAFCDGDVRSHYMNMSRIDDLEITGLPDDAPISLECYTIINSTQNSPLWTTYSFSV
jgi:hypothetical protein